MPDESSMEWAGGVGDNEWVWQCQWRPVIVCDRRISSKILELVGQMSSHLIEDSIFNGARTRRTPLGVERAD